MYSIHSEKESVSHKIRDFIADNIKDVNFPVVDEKPNKITVGPYKIVTEGDLYEVRLGKTLLHSFSSRAWATAYAYFSFAGNKDKASMLVQLDKQFGKLLIEKFIFQHHIKTSLQQDNEERAYVLEDRLSRVESEISFLKNEAKRLINF